jgi:hypothetical protein
VPAFRSDCKEESNAGYRNVCGVPRPVAWSCQEFASKNEKSKSISGSPQSVPSGAITSEELELPGYCFVPTED